MEDVKWLLKKCGLPILILLFAVIAGVICWGKLHTEERKVAEEVWEPPVEMENSEATTEADAETSTESAYWFIPQIALFQMRKRSNYKVRCCQQPNQSAKYIRIS